MFESPRPPRLGATSSYEVVRRLGGGAASDVWLATAHGPYGFKRPVAIKRLARQALASTPRPEAFAREATGYARITHPNVVRLYDFFETEDELCIVLELVDGIALGRLQALARAAGNPLSDDVAYFVAQGVFAALEAAHGARDPESGEFAPIIHRDVSPDNVLLGWDGSVKLTDFGFAKVSGVAGDTRAGLLKGTYGYMAPEQVMGDPVTVRTDVYAACVILRELLLGEATFDRGSLPELEILQAMAAPRLAPIETLRSGVPASIAAALPRGLAAHPDARTLTASEMLATLRRAVSEERGQRALVDALAAVRDADAWALVEQRATTRPRGLRTLPAAGPSTARLASATSARGEPPRRRDLVAHAPPKAPEPNVSPVRPLRSRPRELFDTPRAMVRAVEEAIPPPGRRAPLAGHAAIGVAVVAVLVVAASLAGRFVAPAAAPPAESQGAAEPIAPSVVPAVAPPPASAAELFPEAPPSAPAAPPAPGATTGRIVVGPSASGHRVYVDGHVEGEGSGAYAVRCGVHVVRIGSSGRSQRVQVPCGGDAPVAR